MYLYVGPPPDYSAHHFSIRFFLTVHMRARLPYMYIGIEKSMRPR